MTRILASVLGRLPIGWLQLTHNRGRLLAAVAGVAFANLLVFMQLGILGALNGSTIAPYSILRADIILSPEDGNTLTDGGSIPRARMFQGLGIAGVSSATPLYIGNLPLTWSDGSSASLLVFGFDTSNGDYMAEDIARQAADLQTESTVLLDLGTRGLPSDLLDRLQAGDTVTLEINSQTVSVVGTLDLGGGFLADGTLVMSDQSFLRFFPKRNSGTPSHILIKVDDGLSIDVLVQRLRDALPSNSVRVQSLRDAAAADLSFMSTERPTGIIFGFGVLIGVIVGIVIVYQILSTDVADHLSEYATFKAMGYAGPFFLGIVFEEAVILAIFGFIPGFLVSLGLYEMLSTVTSLPVTMDSSRVILVFLGTLAACSISGAIATRRLANADPADLF